MRIAALELARYGHFDAMALEFPHALPDLHLVIGDNEAGKTTIRHALMDLLFGIQSRGHPYAFEARVSQLRLEAAIAVGDTVHRVVRTSSTKEGLAPPDAATAVRDALDGVDRALFSRARAFSHDEMRAQSEELQRSKGELRDVLMASVGGLERADVLLRELESRAGSLFDRRRSKKSDVQEIKKQRESALERYENARLSAEGHRGLREAVERARVDEQAARAQAERVRVALAQVEALIGAERVAERLRDWEGELADLPERRMPAQAEARVLEARNAVELARAKHDAAKRVVADLATRREALASDHAALAQRSAIRELEQQMARRLAADERREEWQAVRRTQRAEALRQAREIGLAGEGADVARGLVPRLERVAVLRLMRKREGLEKDRAATLANLESVPDAPAPVPDGPSRALRDALRLVDELGKVDRDYSDAMRAADGARETFRAANAARSADPRTEANPPPLEEGVAAEKTIAEAATRFDAAREAVRAAREDVAKKAEAVDADTDGVPTREILQSARARRDAAWEKIVAGAPLAEAAPPFRAFVDEADRVADARFDAAHKVAAAERAALDLKAAEAVLRTRLAAADEAEADFEARRRAWAARLDAVGLAEPPADYAAWFARRQAAADAAHALKVSEAHADALGEEIRHAVTALARALDRPIPDELAGMRGPALLRVYASTVRDAQTALAAAQTARSEALAAHKAYHDAEAKRPILEAACGDAEAALAQWGEEWAVRAAQHGLDPAIDLARLEDLFGVHEAIEQALAKADDAQREIESDDAKEQAFAATTAELARGLHEAHDGQPRVTASRLVARLAEAERAEEQRQEIDAALEQAQAALSSAEAAVREAMAETAADREAAGLPRDAGLDALLAAARQSDRRRALEALVRDAREGLQSAGLAWPAVGERLAGESPDQRRARKADLEAQLGQLAEAVSDAAQRYGGAARALRDAEERSGVGDAHRALAEVTTLSAALAQTAAAAIDSKLQLAVLSAARKAFADRRESPVLERAQTLFRTLTGGRYGRLHVEHQGADDAHVLAERSADGVAKSVSGLSDGTRDQLVLAVRLAALEDDGLPFIADDLFVNADDRRAGHGFRALADAARGRQVFYLTHHQHLADIARSALGAPVNVIHLPAAP